jgi:hypothetical protein
MLQCYCAVLYESVMGCNSLMLQWLKLLTADTAAVQAGRLVEQAAAKDRSVVVLCFVSNEL